MPQFTIVVPLMDQVNAFETTLASVLRNAPPQSEVMVVHDGSYSDPHQILSEISSVIVPGKRVPSVIGRVAVASSAARSPWVIWIAPGIELTESFVNGLPVQLQQSNLGLISPRIVPSDVGVSRDIGGSSSEIERGVEPAYLASSVVLTSRYHPAYLEELVGENWTVADVKSQHRVCGPTSWAGGCRRQILEQWADNTGRSFNAAARRPMNTRLPMGYAELSLGLLAMEMGWEHQWATGELQASEWATQSIEQGYPLDGRSSNHILATHSQKKPWARLSMSLWLGLLELGSSPLNLQLLKVAAQRFSGLNLAFNQNRHLGALSGEDRALGQSRPESDEPSEVTPANKERLRTTERLRSAA